MEEFRRVHRKMFANLDEETTDVIESESKYDSIEEKEEKITPEKRDETSTIDKPENPPPKLRFEPKPLAKSLSTPLKVSIEKVPQEMCEQLVTTSRPTLQPPPPPPPARSSSMSPGSSIGLILGQVINIWLSLGSSFTPTTYPQLPVYTNNCSAR